MQNNPNKAECRFTRDVHRARQGAVCSQLRHCETMCNRCNYHISAPHLTYGHDSFPTWKQCHEDSMSKCVGGESGASNSVWYKGNVC